MYIIQLKQYSFQSNENIQHFLDQILIQSTLLEYYIELYSLNPIYDENIMYQLSITDVEYYLFIKFFVDKITNQLNVINFRYYHQNDMLLELRGEKNFHYIFQNIINLLDRLKGENKNEIN